MSSATGARLQSPGTLLPEALLVVHRVPEMRPGLCVYRHLVCVSGGPRWAQLRLAARHEDIGDPPPPPCLKKAFSLPLHLHDEGSHIVTTQCTDEKFNLPSGSPTAVEIQDSTGTKPVFLGVRLF